MTDRAPLYTPERVASAMTDAYGRTEARRRAVEQATSERMADREFWTAVVSAIGSDWPFPTTLPRPVPAPAVPFNPDNHEDALL